MFDETAIEEYRQVAASSNLKERVMKTYQTGNAKQIEPVKKSNIRSYHTLSLAAACLALVIAATVFAGRGDDRVTVSVNGTQISEAPVTIAMEDAHGVMMASVSRSVQPQISIPLDVETAAESTIAVTDGEIQIFDVTTKELLFTGTEYHAEGNIAVIWIVEATGEDLAGKAPSMNITAKGETRTLQLGYEEAKETLVIYQK